MVEGRPQDGQILVLLGEGRPPVRTKTRLRRAPSGVASAPAWVATPCSVTVCASLGSLTVQKVGSRSKGQNRPRNVLKERVWSRQIIIITFFFFFFLEAVPEIRTKMAPAERTSAKSGQILAVLGDSGPDKFWQFLECRGRPRPL